MSGRPVHSFEVARTEQVSPHVVRVVLGGNGFDTFVPNQFTDAYCKVLFLRDDVDVATLPTPLTLDSFQVLPPERRPVIRTLTVRRTDPGKREIAIDFVPDELESKLEIFCLIDRMAPPRTILCTPTEALSITDLASCTYRGDRCFGVRGGLGEGAAVRVLRPEAADAEVVARVRGFFEALGWAVGVEVDPDAPMLVKNVVVG